MKVKEKVKEKLRCCKLHGVCTGLHQEVQKRVSFAYKDWSSIFCDANKVTSIGKRVASMRIHKTNNLFSCNCKQTKNVSHDRVRRLEFIHHLRGIAASLRFSSFLLHCSILTEGTDCRAGQHFAEFHSLSGHPTELAVQSFLMLLDHKHIYYLNKF